MKPNKKFTSHTLLYKNAQNREEETEQKNERNNSRLSCLQFWRKKKDY